MLRLHSLLLSVLAAAAASSARADIDWRPTRIADIDATADRLRAAGKPAYIELTGTVLAKAMNTILLADGSGAATVSDDIKPKSDWTVGDTVRVGIGVSDGSERNVRFRTAYRLRVIGRGELPPATRRPIERAVPDGRLPALVLTEGVVTDAFLDEVDPLCCFIILETRNARLTAVTDAKGMTRTVLDGLIDKTVAVSGILQPDSGGLRANIGNVLLFNHADIRVLRPDEATCTPPVRRTLNGTVVATWDTNALFLRTGDGQRTKVFLVRGETLPPSGAAVSVSGYPRANVFFEDIVGARLSPGTAEASAAETPLDIRLSDVFEENGDNRHVNPRHEGRLVRLEGTVLRADGDPGPNGSFWLSADGGSVRVHAGRLAVPPVGSRIRVTGACLITYDNDPRGAGFIRLTGFSLVPRTADDLETLAPPPWWTPRRFLSVIAILCVLTLAAGVWIVSMRAVAERRGRALVKEQLEHFSSMLRVDERTRLAVELHDAMSQNLTGVSLQIDAAIALAPAGAEATLDRLAYAAATLQSCRNELRNCLWDLRNDTLGESDMNVAIRRTLEPQVGGLPLSIDFDVPRDRLSDSTAHALLKIIRELATNAVRHGKARTLRIDGRIDGDRLLCSVSDDGCGFDVGTAPGIATGHFGLQGIRERIARIGGTLSIDTAPGRGTTVSISLKEHHS